MNWEAEIKRIKNNQHGRVVSTMFRPPIFPDCDPPTFYQRTEDIPSKVRGLYFLWWETRVDFIGGSSTCVRTAIKRNKKYRPDRHIISVARVWSWADCVAGRRFLLAILRPDLNASPQQPKRPGRPARMPNRRSSSAPGRAGRPG